MPKYKVIFKGYAPGGCNPAPLDRTVVGDKLVINMQDINMNTWYMKYRQS